MQCQVSLPPVVQRTKSFLMGPSKTGMKNAHGWLPAFNGRPLIREGLRGNSVCCGRSHGFIVPRWCQQERRAWLEERQGQKFAVGHKICWSRPLHPSTRRVSYEQASPSVCVVLLHCVCYGGHSGQRMAILNYINNQKCQGQWEWMKVKCSK